MRLPAIDLAATGQNIRRLREERGISVRELGQTLGLSEGRTIYKWQRGVSLPSVDNLLALSVLLKVPIDQILIYN